ncbi:phosphoglucosamine mutase [Adlercreutzia sp. R25]|uniref:phosphoglucosamine mutase n=1 Tax=Adlercreutzia shanghongiae TaxID=3111773 RepID=UPI002DB714B2|nr:phosphoglucosamine mutase [Adlercreutzia sp. R25]MEC4273037.1 phosphoglucosamine mutase [Adlercreutzia sp. R25]
MARLFGTDGVRGIANVELTCEMAYRLGQAAAIYLGKTIVVGRDTRRSGDMLGAALSAGIMSAGGTVLEAGIIPTPGVALLVREMRAAGGAVISASHNPPEYNGIKLFDAQGFKLPDAVEDEIEAFIVRGGLEGEVARAEEVAWEAAQAAGTDAVADATSYLASEIKMPSGAEVGVAIELEKSCDIYIDHVARSIEEQGVSFEALRIALDTGHGASALTSPEALRRLGAEVFVINDDFNGMDINVQCGSTHLEPLRELMAETGADVGIAHDGDADRVMLMTPDGTEIDGDMVEAVCALDMRERGVLAGDAVVSTVMANFGFVRAMREAGINVVQTKVGDRYVLEAMREHGYSIGGEQSGHMILLDHNSTGDGLMTACQFLAAVIRSGKPVGEAIRVMEKMPQTLINVRVADKHAVDASAEVAAAVAAAEEALGDDGRVLLRPSGTEPVVRVMVEAVDPAAAKAHAETIAAVVEANV